MNKKQRIQDLKTLITNEIIRTQDELRERLIKMGYNVTQATISRDIKDLKIVKTADELGNLRYCVVPEKPNHVTDFSTLYHLIKSIRKSLNIIVIKTSVGMAQGVAAALDCTDFTEILGTIAGDDTIMIVCDSEESTAKIYNYLNENLA